MGERTRWNRRGGTRDSAAGRERSRSGAPLVLRTLGIAIALVLLGAVLFSAPAMAADPQLTHQASGSGFPIPAPVFDFATLAGGDNPTGTITFTAFGPDDPTCAGGAAFTSTKTVTGNGNYQSDNFNPNEAGLYRFIASYSGDANNTAVSTACSDPAGEVFAPKAIPQFSTQASLLSVGGQITDTATLDGAGPAGPTGTITFDLYGPNNLTCVPPAIFTSTVPVNGDGQYVSDPFTPTVSGTYQWRAAYSGDANNNAVGSICTDLAESVVVVVTGLITPTLTTAASAVGRGRRVGQRHRHTGRRGRTHRHHHLQPLRPRRRDVLGHRGVHLHRVGVGQRHVPVGPLRSNSRRHVPVGGLLQRRRRPQPRDHGVQRPRRVGGRHRASVGHPHDPGVAARWPSAVRSPTPPSVAGGTNPTGTITFTLFGPDDATCAGAAASTSTRTVAGNGTYTSDPFTPTAAGTYRWVASYSGDANHVAVTSPCNAANESVVVTGAPVATLTTQASPSVAVGGQVADTATLADATDPTGTITFTLFGPDNAACTPPSVFTSTKTVAGNGTYSSDPFTPTAPGTYRWVASYSGDANNAAITSPCNSPNESVVVTGAPVATLTTQASPSVVLGGQVTDTATLAGA